MYQWRKFEFFEEKHRGKRFIPDEVSGQITCCTSGNGKVVFGSDDGSISFLDRGFNFSYGFQAHSSSILFIQQLKQRNFLLSVGEDVLISSQQSEMCVKIFDLDKMQPEGTSMPMPDCVGTLRVFTTQFPKSMITSFLVLEEVPPILLIAIGLDNGCIYCIKGDVARERITRFTLQVDGGLEKADSSVTGLGFKVDGQALQLFAVTPTSVTLFGLHAQPPQRQTLDQIGCDVHCTTMSDRSELIIGRREAVFFYDVDGRGPCWAFDGEKKMLGWFRGYLLCVIADQRNGKDVFNVYDLRNHLIAHSCVLGEVDHMLCEWGSIMLVSKDKSVVCIGEKDMESKLDMLFRKNLYPIAANLVQSQQADPAAAAEVLRKYGDHLYGRQEYDEAMGQYISTIGHLEPSYVVQKFLEAQRIHNLTNYLEKLHEKGLASKDHTTLLLNCYTKLKAVDKLNVFVTGEEGGGEQKFDVETAIRVCRTANYHEHAMHVAKKAGRHEWYLKILLEDLERYGDALEYISSLDRGQAGATMKEYGRILVGKKPEETIDLLVKLCKEDDDGGHETSKRESFLPSPVDFLNIFVHHPESLMKFLERCTEDEKESPALVEIHNTLIELYISHDLSGAKIDMECKHRRYKGLCLLKSAWPSGMDRPLYDVDHAIMVCELNEFKDGLLYLYEKMKLYRQLIACYMRSHDHEGLIACCKKVGDSNGGDPSLWADLLKYFSELGEDCSKEVKEVVSYIEKGDILPPVIVLQTLAKNPCLTLSVIKDYIGRKLEQESRLIEEDRRAIEKYQESTAAMRKEIEELRTSARIFQLSKCTACSFTLDLPAVHFMCMHSFHLRCLGDNEKDCPVCTPEHQSVMEMRRRMEQSLRDEDSFFHRIKSSKDGFSVIAEYFGKGIVSKTITRQT